MRSAKHRARPRLASAAAGTLGLALLAAVAPVAGGAAFAETAAPSQATRYVSTAGDDGTASDPNTCTTPSQPCRTIQHAIDEAAAGDTVSIGPGTFDTALEVDKNLTLAGSGAGTIVHSSDPNSTIVDVTASGAVTLRELTLTGGLRGVYSKSGAAITIARSTITGVGPAVSGYAVEIDGGTLNLADSTLTDNGAGLAVYASLPYGSGRAVIIASTVAGNMHEGVFVNTGNVADVAGSIIAGNGIDCSDAGGTVTDRGYNLESGTSCGFSTAAHSRPSSDPLLQPAPPSGNGGPTPTLAPASGSPVVDEIPAGTGTTIAGTVHELCAGTDQRGVTRPQGDGCDIGAVELASSTTTLTSSANPTVAPAVRLSAAVTGQSGLPDPVGAVSFADGAGPLAGCTSVPLSHGNASCDVSGLAVGAHQFTATYSATNGYHASSAALTQQVHAALQIATTSLPDATAGQPYRATLHASGGVDSDYTWSLADGSALPPGLTLTPDGVLSGTPTRAGTFSFTVSVNDPVTAQLTLTVAPAASGGGAGSPGPSGGTAASGGGSGTPTASGTGLADTGFRTRAAVLGGLLLLLAGCILALGGRTRGDRR